MSNRKPTLFGPALKTKTVRSQPGRPELTMGQREEKDRRIADLVWKEIEELKSLGYPYTKARTRALQRAAEAFHKDPSVIAKTWRWWEPYYRSVQSLKREARAADRAIEALMSDEERENASRDENQGKELDE